MNAQQNAPISDRFSSLCARVFSPAAAILESEKTLGTRLGKIMSCPAADWQATGGEKLFTNIYNPFSISCLFCFIFSSLNYNELKKRISCYYVRRRR